MTRQEQIDQARAAVRVARAKYDEMQKAAEFLRDELPKAQQAWHAARESLSRLEAQQRREPGRMKQKRDAELERLKAQLAELKEGA
ncbi:hypothetical protein E8F11_22865 [Pseudomonas sp. BN417]|uniref:hypothetical protein n=1 Tax=Pseudomonas sp. BN417 TaxID=2567890 RepID=UPI0024564982|nr:hypothetical protein [Pseudomonas sp. BN417]MDH4557981.1 hypothetical protein [Pseudomonas sp. BN417]